MPSRKPKPRKLTPVEQLARAVGHPLRLRILELIREHEIASPHELHLMLKEPLSNTSYHTRVLHLDCEVIKEKETRQVRGATEHFYCLAEESVIRGTRLDGLELPAKLLRDYLAGAALQSLLSCAVEAIEAGSIADSRGMPVDWMQLRVDPKGATEAKKVLAATSRRLAAIRDRSQRRLADSGENGAPFVAGVVGFIAAKSST